MGAKSRVQNSVADAVDSYVEMRARERKLVSTSDALRAIKDSVSRSGHSDRELVGLIAAAAVKADCTIDFDAGEDFGGNSRENSHRRSSAS